MIRAVWVDAGSDADTTKLEGLGITRPFFDLRDPRVTLPYLEALRDRGFTPGVYAAASWWPQLGGAAFADTVSGMLEVVAKGTPASFPEVCLDIERDDIRGYLLPALRRWRQHRPSRVTDLTLEGHKGGLFSSSDVVNVAAKVRFVVPQAYDGGMHPWAPAEVVRDLTAAGFPIAQVYPFLDAATALLPWWQGYAFTQGRLP